MKNLKQKKKVYDFYHENVFHQNNNKLKKKMQEILN